MPLNDQFLKRLRKKAKKGMRGWPVATIAFYGSNLSQATKVAVGIIPSETAEPLEVRDWNMEDGDVRTDPNIARELLDFIESHRVLSVISSKERVPPNGTRPSVSSIRSKRRPLPSVLS